MNAPIPDPSLIACHIDESAGMDPAVEGNAWPFQPGDVVRDSGEDGDDAAWLDAAPERTVVSDLDGDEWTRKNDGLWWMNRGRTARAKSVDLCTHVGPLAVVSVPAHAARPAVPSGPATPPVGVRTSEGATGAPGGAGEVGLGDAIRAAFNMHDVPLKGYLDDLADRADALERDLDAAVQRHLASAENHGATIKASQKQARAIERVRALIARSEYGGDPRVEDLRAALDGTQ